MPSAIATPPRQAALLWMTGADPSAYFVPPTGGNWEIALYDADGVELSGGGYARKLVAAAGLFEVYTGVSPWRVRNAAGVEWDAAATDNWAGVSEERWRVEGETDVVFTFVLDAIVSVTTGLKYGFNMGDRVLRDAGA